MTPLLTAMNIDRPVGWAVFILTLVVLAACIGWAGLVTGGGYHGRLPWDQREGDPLEHPCPKCGARRGEPCTDVG